MVGEHPFALRRADLGWLIASVIVLLPCLYYPYRSVVPRLPVTLAPDWQVRGAEECADEASCLEVGDRVLSIGDVSYEEYARSRNSHPFRAFESPGTVEVRVLRGGEERVIAVEARPGLAAVKGIEVLVVLFPFVFWLMGTVAIIFLRPRDERWLVLMLFHYVTAIWFASGLASFRQVAGAGFVFHFFVWFSLPLAVHLHLILPEPLVRRRRWWLLAPLYAASLALAILDCIRPLDPVRYLYVAWFLAGLVIAFGLLLARLFLPASPAARVASRIMLYGVAVGFGPVILFYVPSALAPYFLPVRLDVASLWPPTLGILLVAIPILPLSYFYAIYKHHLTALEFRANRLLGVYSFFSLYIAVYVVTLFLTLQAWAPVDRRALGATLAISLAFVGVAPFLRGRFQALVDRHVFGIRHAPEEVVQLVASKIPTAFNRTVLAQVVVNEILPTLLIRQSALYLFGDSAPGDAGIETLYEQGLPADQASPSAAELERLLRRAGRYLPPSTGAPGSRSATTEAPLPGWTRLAIPLGIHAEALGVWLFGRRDPDDHYPASDIQLLSTVANQIAPMLENIRLYERAQQEIAQRRAAEEEIRRSEERHRHLFEATLEGIAIVKHGEILEVNRALCGMFGYPAPELIGQPLSTLFSTDEATLTAEPGEGVGRKRDGSRVTLEIAAQKYVIQGEDVTVVAVRDIERRKRDEEENRHLQRQLLHSQKMEAIGRLSAGVAHDFNNCLLAIFGLSDFLLARAGDDELQVRGLSGIREAGEKAAVLTKQLLAFTRQQPMEPHVMSLNAVVSGVEKMVRGVLGEKVELVTRLAPDLPDVRIDPVQLEQVILNLAVNAHDAMPRGGRLTVETEPVDLAAGATPHPDLAPGRYAQLTVKDTGIGMNAATQGRVFEPFFSTKKLGEGTGLGLSTAYGIVHQSGGHITVESAPGKGATFTIYLPAVASPSAAAGAAAASAGAA